MNFLQPLPPLRGQEARDFLRRLKENENTPLYLKPVPKIELAKKLARERLDYCGDCSSAV